MEFKPLIPSFRAQEKATPTISWSPSVSLFFFSHWKGYLYLYSDFLHCLCLTPLPFILSHHLLSLGSLSRNFGLLKYFVDATLNFLWEEASLSLYVMFNAWMHNKHCISVFHWSHQEQCPSSCWLYLSLLHYWFIDLSALGGLFFLFSGSVCANDHKTLSLGIPIYYIFHSYVFGLIFNNSLNE